MAEIKALKWICHWENDMESKEQATKMRLLYIARILYEESDAEHYFTTNQLRQLLLDRYGIESHRQTIPTDMEALRSIGMNVREYLGTQKRYWLEDRTLTVPEVKLLIDAVNSSRFITKKKSVELQDKLLRFVSCYEAEGLKRNISVEHRVKRDNEQIYRIIDAVNNAINQGKKISFRYFKYDTNKRPKLRNGGEPYVFSPHQLVWNGDFYYVVGVNEDGEVRIFRLDRMEGRPQILDALAKGLPRGFSMSKFLNTTFRMFGTGFTTVTLLCDNDVVDSILDRFGKSVEIQPVDETHFRNSEDIVPVGPDRFRIVVDVAVSNVFYGWVFGFGGKVKIEGPEEVKEEYQKMVRKAVE